MTELAVAMIMIAIFHDKLQFSVFACEEEHLHGNFLSQRCMHFFVIYFLKPSVGPKYRVGRVMPM